ncbi:methyltransferase domain-containing protein [Oscillochloris sp. ZM17-4]|uniref:methyltransferase domain-containing protein n=1 Tax=Oscillochloris sp. ZM17-4 TaxID=2866714 RepID=UPI001C72AB5D|nr:methyltransferase domain-containing protein [Oscillochloris sp. ZM17-4]MBX0327335.1 methyltransferase domain-containing protein [Oscillochloris sp. ZM17-4]
MGEQNPQQLYDEFYYATGLGLPYRRDEHWTTFFGRVADEIVAAIGPGSVLDAGCALGLLVEQLRERGVDAEGVDISEYAIANAPEAVRPFVRVGSVAEPPGRRYDLIVCIEVLEHMPREEAERAIAAFCAHADDVLFSSTPLDFKEATHFNVHPIEHWAELFARHGFVRDVDFDGSFLTPWTIRFRRSGEPPARIVRSYERRFWELWKANTDLRELVLEQRQQIDITEAAIRDARDSMREAHRLLAARTEELQDAHRMLNARTTEYARLEAERMASIAQVEAYAARLEADLAQKIAHIDTLKGQIARVESGRLMRIMRALRRRG